MPIRQALGQQVHSFSPDEVTILDDAFTAALTQLGIADRNAPTPIRLPKRSSSWPGKVSAIQEDYARKR